MQFNGYICFDVTPLLCAYEKKPNINTKYSHYILYFKQFNLHKTNTYFYWQVKKQCKASQQQGKKLQDKEKVEVQKDSF